MVGLLALSVLGHVMIGAAGDCRVKPITFRPGTLHDIKMGVATGRSCVLVVQIASAGLDNLSIDRFPQFGSLQPQGRTRVVYSPRSAFKGEDYFAIALKGRGTSEMVGRVSVTVD